MSLGVIMPNLKSFNVNLKIPGIGGIQGTWEPDKAEKEAAWEMYVELITRISIVELKKDEGVLREALSSLHSLFDTTRNIMRKYGPSIAKLHGKGDISFGSIAITILNGEIRPFLAKWHPLLLDYEDTRSETISVVEHEKNWDKSQDLRQELNEVREVLVEYANLLAEVSEVPNIHIPN